jgi:hypothetical protein
MRRDVAALSTAVTLRNSGFGGRVHALLPQNVVMRFVTVLPFHSSDCPQHLQMLDLRSEHAFLCVEGVQFLKKYSH